MLFIMYRSSVCDRPRTYDKFYKKGPSNFQGGIGDNGRVLAPNKGIATVCSSEEDDIPNVSSGSGSQRTKRKKKRRGEKLQYSRTITEKDVRSIERHLSMKKTIRKKIMRDLQQAFVEGDPNEISTPIELGSPEKRNEINLKSLNIAPKQNSKSDSNFLDALRGGECNNSDDSGNCSGPSPIIQSTHHVRNNESKVPNPPTSNRNARRYNFISDSGGSSCGGDESLENVVYDDDGDEDIIVVAAEQIESFVIDGRTVHPAEYHNNIGKRGKTKSTAAIKNCNYMNSYYEGKALFANERSANNNYRIISSTTHNEAISKKKSSEKKTLWQKITGGGGNCAGKNRVSVREMK